jgi:N-acetylmuramoyl-L-alanine amidase
MVPAHKTTIMVHCLATQKSWGKGKSAVEMVKEVRKWHVEDRGWRDIAYAAIIDYEGAWAPGRDLDKDGDVWEETGAGATGWNKNTIHLALAGGHGGNADDKFSDHFTEAQNNTLRMLIARINREAGRTLALKGHNEVANKACPCFRVRPWYAEVAPIKKPKSDIQNIFAAIIRTLKGLLR